MGIPLPQSRQGLLPDSSLFITMSECPVQSLAQRRVGRVKVQGKSAAWGDCTLRPEMQSSVTGLYLYGFLISECHRDQAGQLTEGTVASEVAPQMARSKVLGRMSLQIPNPSSEEGRNHLQHTRQARPSPQALPAMGMRPSETWKVRSLLPCRDVDTHEGLTPLDRRA